MGRIRMIAVAGSTTIAKFAIGLRVAIKPPSSETIQPTKDAAAKTPRFIPCSVTIVLCSVMA